LPTREACSLSAVAYCLDLPRHRCDMSEQFCPGRTPAITSPDSRPRAGLRGPETRNRPLTGTDSGVVVGAAASISPSSTYKRNDKGLRCCTAKFYRANVHHVVLQVKFGLCGVPDALDSAVGTHAVRTCPAVSGTSTTDSRPSPPSFMRRSTHPVHQYRPRCLLSPGGMGEWLVDGQSTDDPVAIAARAQTTLHPVPSVDECEHPDQRAD
jgi:hypothetical protein